MTMIELLEKIENKEIENGDMFGGGSFFYPLVVIDKKLYVINTIAMKFQMLDSDDIGNCITKNYKFNKYKMVLD